MGVERIELAWNIVDFALLPDDLSKNRLVDEERKKHDTTRKKRSEEIAVEQSRDDVISSQDTRFDEITTLIFT